MDVKEFRADFVKAVNGVLEKHLSILFEAPKKEWLNVMSENLFSIVLRMLIITDKIKGGGK